MDTNGFLTFKKLILLKKTNASAHNFIFNINFHFIESRAYNLIVIKTFATLVEFPINLLTLFSTNTVL